MIAKIISNHGTGSAEEALRYTAGEYNHKGEKRDAVIHLFGDGQTVIDLTKSMRCKHTYLSSVLSFTKEEAARLSIPKIKRIAEGFAEHHAGGVGVASIAGCAYLHVENERYDVHLIQAQLDLQTGKRVDLYLDTCGDTQRIADFQDIKNYEFKLDDPRDPARQRLSSDKVREIKSREELRTKILNQLEQKHINGAINSRSDVCIHLESLGFTIARQTKNFISIKSSQFNKNFRLTGEIFNESYAGINGSREAIEASARRRKADYRQQYESACKRLTESNQKRDQRISKKLKVNLKARSFGLQQSDKTKTNNDLDSILSELSFTGRSRKLVSIQHGNIPEAGSNEQFPDNPASKQNLRNHSTDEGTQSPEWELPHPTRLTGETYEHTVYKVPSPRTHAKRAKRHAKAMHGLSESSRNIEQAGKHFGLPGFSGRAAFSRTREKTYASIERFSNLLKNVALKLKKLLPGCRIERGSSGFTPR